MKSVVHPADGPRGQVRIDLGRRDVGVTQHHLHGAQVRPALQQVARETVAQRVRRHALAQPRPARRAQHDLPERLPGERAAPRPDEEQRRRAARGREAGTRLGEVAVDPRQRLAADRHQTLLASLAGALHVAGAAVDVRHAQRERFRRAQTAGVEQLEQRAVAHPARRGDVRRLDERGHRLARERARQRPRPAGLLDVFGRVLGDGALAHEVRVESPQRGQSARDRGRLAARAALALHPREHVVAARGVERPAARPEHAEEVADVAAVGVEGVAGRIALGAESGEELLERALGLHPAMLTGQRHGAEAPCRPPPRFYGPPTGLPVDLSWSFIRSRSLSSGFTLSSPSRGLADGVCVLVSVLTLPEPVALPLGLAPGLCVSGALDWPLAFVFVSTPTLGLTPTPMFGLTFVLMVVFCALAGRPPRRAPPAKPPRSKRTAASFQNPLCVGCGRVITPHRAVAGVVPPARVRNAWRVYNGRGAPSSRAITVRWIWLVPS